MLIRLWIATAFLLLGQMAMSQSTIEGRVTGPEGRPLAGANVLLVGTDTGDAADAEGRYRLSSVPAGKHLVRVTYLGYQPLETRLEVPVEAETLKFDFELKEQAIQVQELVVTATRAGEKTPMTYVNLDKEELDENNLGQDVPYLLRWTPSAVVTSDAGAGVGYTGIRIRGTDPTRINVTINGIPLNDAESQGVFWVNMPDFISSTSSVQVQRGVGTSTNGAGAFGATINLSTIEANPETFGEINASLGSFNTRKANVRFGSGLLNERFILEGRLSRINSDGYIDRARSDLESFYLAGTYLGESSSLSVNVFSGHEETYQAWYGVPADLIDNEQERTFNPAGTEKPGEPYKDEVDNYGQTHVQLLYNNQLSDNWLLNLNGHYTKGSGYFEQYKANEFLPDYGLSIVTLGDTTVSNTDLIRRLWLDNDFYGTTYSLNYEDDEQRLQATLGGAFNIYEGDHFGEVIWAQFFSDGFKDMRYYENDARKTDFNIFGKVNFELLPRLNAYVDLQYRRVGYEFLGFNRDGANVEQSVQLDFFNPKAGLYYTISERSELYGSFAVANREPNRNDYVESTPDSRPQPERLYNTELGYRYRWNKAAISANLYHMAYRDQLALNGEINDVGAYTRINIDRSYRLGLELVGGAELTPGLRLNGNATFSRNKVQSFTEFVDTYNTDFEWTGQKTIEHEDTDLSFSPSIIAGGELSYEMLRDNPTHDFDLALLSKYVSKQYIDNTSDEDNTIDPYSFTDLRLRYRLRAGFADEIEVTLLVNNLFDNLYETNAWSYRYLYAGETVIDQGFFPQAGRNFLLGMRLRM